MPRLKKKSPNQRNAAARSLIRAKRRENICFSTWEIDSTMEDNWSKKRSKLHSLLFTRTNSPVPPEFRSASPASTIDPILDPVVIKSEPIEQDDHQSPFAEYDTPTHTARLSRNADRSSLLKSVLTCPMDMLGQTGLMDTSSIEHTNQSYSRSPSYRDEELRKMLAAPITRNTSSYNSKSGTSSPSLYHNMWSHSPQRDSSSPNTNGKPTQGIIDSIVESEIETIRSDASSKRNQLDDDLTLNSDAYDMTNESPVFDHTAGVTMVLGDGEVLYKCDICNMTFQHKGTLKVHRRGHLVKPKSKKTKTGTSSPKDYSVTKNVSFLSAVTRDMIDKAVKIELDRDESPVNFELQFPIEKFHSLSDPTDMDTKESNPSDAEQDSTCERRQLNHRDTWNKHDNSYAARDAVNESNSCVVKRKCIDDENDNSTEHVAEGQYEGNSSKRTRLNDEPFIERQLINGGHSSILSQLMAPANNANVFSVDTHAHHPELELHETITHGDAGPIDKSPASPVDDNYGNVEVITVKEEPADEFTLENKGVPDAVRTKHSDIEQDHRQSFTNIKNSDILTSMLNNLNSPGITSERQDRQVHVASSTPVNMANGDQHLTGADRMFANLHNKARVSEGQLDEDGRMTFPLYQCQTCGASFQHAGTLRVHERSHESKVKCPICSKCVTDVRYLKIHMRTHKPEPMQISQALSTNPTLQTTDNSVEISTPDQNSTFQCYICHLVLSNVENFQIHLRSHTDQKLFQCSVCDMGFTRATQLEIHSRIHTGERPFSCLVCHMTFRLKGGLKLHMSTHTADKPYKCDFCDDSFGRKAHLDKHVRYHTGSRPYLCTECQKAFIDLGNLQQHMKRKHAFEGKLFKCIDCRKHFVSESRLQEHMVDCDKNCTRDNNEIDMNDNNKSVNGNHGNNTNYISDINNSISDSNKCYINDNKSISDSNNSFMSDNNKTSINDDNISYLHYNNADYIVKMPVKIKTEVEQNENAPEVNHECHICRQVFMDEKSLQLHMDVKHTQLSLQCPTCPKIYSSKYLLNKHMNKCRKTIACPICGDHFFEIRLLQQHLDTHKATNDITPIMGTTVKEDLHKPDAKFVCNICEAVLPTEKSLLAHYHQHTENIHSCSFCSMNFLTKKALKCHVNAAHENARVGCKYCGKTYKRLQYLTKHVQDCHKDWQDDISPVSAGDDVDTMEEKISPDLCQ